MNFDGFALVNHPVGEMREIPVFSMCSTRVSEHSSTPPGLWNIRIFSSDSTVFSSVF